MRIGMRSHVEAIIQLNLGPGYHVGQFQREVQGLEVTGLMSHTPPAPRVAIPTQKQDAPGNRQGTGNPPKSPKH